MPPYNPSHKYTFPQIWDQVTKTGTFLSILTGIIMLPVEIGRRDQILTNQQESVTELKAVVSDLVKTTINLTGTDRVHDRDLTDLRLRLDRLEARGG
jgi:hypothetical protein